MSEQMQKRVRGEGHLWKLSKLCVSDSTRWFGDQGVHTSVPHMTLAMCGEEAYNR